VENGKATQTTLQSQSLFKAKLLWLEIYTHKSTPEKGVISYETFAILSKILGSQGCVYARLLSAIRMPAYPNSQTRRQ
jgi:hypothetical protein